MTGHIISCLLYSAITTTKLVAMLDRIVILWQAKSSISVNKIEISVPTEKNRMAYNFF